MFKVYTDFEHWGLPLSVSYVPEYKLWMISVLFLTIAVGGPDAP